ncbi:MAG: ribosome biogenesis GTP-binding protein YihA/YsxC [Eubacteriales bacterium]|nr:ribosome biogenesis GTP-binding protein YihA/YsxC [Eubacteriales bacterium]
MIIKQAELETVCGITSTLPETGAPEFAFAGRSNVGKSSLINGLMNRRRLAKTSSTPGKTQTINFYKINNAFYFVDLPGYGYAKANERVKAQWGEMIERYLFSSPSLVAIFLLIDIRHDPTKNDRMMYDFIIDNGYSPIIIATKLDKIKRSQVAKHVKAIRTVLGNPKLEVFPYSAMTKQGREEIYERIDELLEGGRCE